VRLQPENHDRVLEMFALRMALVASVARASARLPEMQFAVLATATFAAVAG
jgi:hypothetical protein